MDRNFFFVRGFQRSGTNWLATLLNLHPRVNCHGEFHLHQVWQALRDNAAPFGNVLYREPVRSVAEESFRDLVRHSLLAVAAWKWDAPWIGDRTPSPIEPVLLPSCPHFVIVRDGRDVLVSFTFNQLAYGGAPGHWAGMLARQAEKMRADPQHFSKHPDDLLTDESWVRAAATGWARQVQADRAALARFESGELSGRGLEVRYETLHTGLEEERARCYAFLGLNPADAGPVSTDPKAKAGYGTGDAQSHFRSGRADAWRPYFNERVSRWFMESAGPAMTELGYA